MIKVTKLKGQEFFINAEMVYSLEQTPDTIITMTDGNKIIVKETPDIIIQRIIEYKRSIQKNVLDTIE